MTAPDRDRSNVLPAVIDVKVNNFPNSERARKTTTTTYILDAAAADLTKRSQQIAQYEPTRTRMVVQVLDQQCIIIVNEPPKVSPDTTSTSVAPGQGRVLNPSSAIEYVFYGPDSFYLNSSSGTTVGRVTVTKEYL